MLNTLLRSVLVGVVMVVARAWAVDGAQVEAERRSDAMVRDGFNLTRGFRFGVADAGPVRIELLVPPHDEEHVVRVWAEAADGGFVARLVSASGEVLGEWKARSLEVSFASTLAAGRYAFELDPASDAPGSGVLGVKGAVVSRCSVSAAQVREFAADPARGFHWPYLLYVPQKVEARHLLVAPNNTGFETEDLELLRASASCQVRQGARLADRLGAPLLVPLFPRPAVYVHALSRDSLSSRVPALRRVDLQLIAMIDDARPRIPAALSPAVSMFGFSASASFASRFAMLHPERVRAVAAGSPGGWPLAPVKSIKREPLNYPVGIADVAALTGAGIDARALARVKWLFFLGDADTNDSVPFRDSFSSADEALITRRFGATPVARWSAAAKLYAQAHLKAQFTLYPDAGHTLTDAMSADVETFLRDADLTAP